MGDGLHVRGPCRQQARMKVPQGRQVRHAERHLVDHIENQCLRLARHQHDLMMLRRIAAQEHQLRGPHRALIGHRETEGLLVEARHAGQIMDIKTHMAKGQLGAFFQA